MTEKRGFLAGLDLEGVREIRFYYKDYWIIGFQMRSVDDEVTDIIQMEFSDFDAMR